MGEVIDLKVLPGSRYPHPYYSHHIKFSSKKLKLVKHICQQKNVICYGAYMVKVTVWVSVSKLTKKIFH